MFWRTKLRHRAIQKSQNQGPILSQFFKKNTITFVLFWSFLVKKGVWSHFKGPELKFDLPYCSLTIVGHVSVQKVWFQHFPVLRL